MVQPINLYEFISPKPASSCHPGLGDCVIIPFSSFRASEARHGIQSRLGGIQYVLDTGFRRHDCLDGTFENCDTAS
ncbi:MAG TPA: hypothetical protein PK874_03305 [Desulfobacteraceae bacterium]|nr:hypothetical protein [Desulfobacteraceae bacterium]HPJ66246.1 hypothetical protein [Desulfobacteraceae bacterium]HPQ27159.1 hypothetical protein [Desulfobacteraceae bacterium]